MSSAKRRLAVGATGLAVLAGAGGAYAATQTGSSAARPDPAAEQKAFLDDLANRLNVPRDKLDAAIKGAAAARVDAAVAAGRLTKEQGDEAKRRIESGGVPLLGVGVRAPMGGHGPGGPDGPGRPGFGFGPGMSLSAAAKFLGLTDEALGTQLRDGKSLAALAKDKGKSVDDLKAAMKAAIAAELDQAVKDNRLSADERTRILAGVDQPLDDLVNDTPPKGGPRLPPLPLHP
jgi:hypothetical protein